MEWWLSELGEVPVAHPPPAILSSPGHPSTHRPPTQMVLMIGQLRTPDVIFIIIVTLLLVPGFS